jgi:hypothetical protein
MHHQLDHLSDHALTVHCGKALPGLIRLSRLAIAPARRGQFMDKLARDWPTA